LSRITTKFNELQKKQKKALIPFFTVGDPNLSQTVPLMHTMVAGGVDILELGVPFSDPMADGPVIQRASERALNNGVTLQDVLMVVQEFRRSNDQTPVVLMGYANPVEKMGWAAFARQCQQSGVDGILIVDYPAAAMKARAELLKEHGLDIIFLVSPTTTETRIKEIGQMASGYVYLVSLRGVTGASHLDEIEVKNLFDRMRRYTDLPIGVGFGISTPELAFKVAQISDAVVVGSRLVEVIEQSTPETLHSEMGAIIKNFRVTMDQTQ
jgi:tryptophan synthase alpha chain